MTPEEIVEKIINEYNDHGNLADLIIQALIQAKNEGLKEAFGTIATRSCGCPLKILSLIKTVKTEEGK